MSNRLLFIFAIIACLSIQSCQNQPNNTANNGTSTPAANSNAHFQGPVKWISIEELEANMKAQPKKVLVDLYTDWCGWCKRMDKSTFSNEELANYINQNFYAVKFNAETPTPVNFNGQTYTAQSNGKRATNMLAYKLILGDQPGGRVGYPTFAFLDEQLNRIDAYPGYKDASGFDVVAHFIAENHYKTSSLPQFQQSFKSSISAAATPAANLNQQIPNRTQSHGKQH